MPLLLNARHESRISVLCHPCFSPYVHRISAEPGAPQTRIAFARDSNLWTTNLDGTKTRKLVKGDDPCISPDGTKVAFTMSPRGGRKSCAISPWSQVATGATQIFKATPSDNCFGPVWSPDGSQIVFEIFVENHWRLGLVNADGSGFRFFQIPDARPGLVVALLGLPTPNRFSARILRKSAASASMAIRWLPGKSPRLFPKEIWTVLSVLVFPGRQKIADRYQHGRRRLPERLGGTTSGNLAFRYALRESDAAHTEEIVRFRFLLAKRLGILARRCGSRRGD